MRKRNTVEGSDQMVCLQRLDQSLTAIEYANIDLAANVADGHAKLTPVRGLEAELSLFKLCRTRQRDLEEEFLIEFAEHGYFRDSCFRSGRNSWLASSASIAIDVVMKYLVSVGVESLGILEPTFDNIPALAQRAGLDLTAIAESEELADDVANLEAVFLVIPNNPTGWVPSNRTLIDLLHRVAKNGTLLVIDRAFRFFAEMAFLESALRSVENLRWVTIDDTGKTWSTLECKVSTVSSNDPQVIQEIREIGEELTLNVSPISLALCTRAMRLEGGARRVRRAVAVNRKLLHTKIESECGRVLTVGSSSMSVATLHLSPELGLTGTQLSTLLSKNGSGVLPGRQFYWSLPARGESTVRVALARDKEHFSEAVRIICDVIQRWST